MMNLGLSLKFEILRELRISEIISYLTPWLDKYNGGPGIIYTINIDRGILKKKKPLIDDNILTVVIEQAPTKYLSINFSDSPIFELDFQISENQISYIYLFPVESPKCPVCIYNRANYTTDPVLGPLIDFNTKKPYKCESKHKN